jgi:zinc protease
MEQLLDRSIPPLIKLQDEFNIRHADKAILDNGISLYSVSAGFQDVIRVEFLFPNPQFNPQKPLTVNATHRLLNEGTSKHNAQQLADMVDYYGSFYETDQSADYCSVVLLSLNKHLEETLPIVYEIVTDAVFPDHELSVFKQNNKQRLVVENERVNSVARKKFNEMMFGANHPYGFYIKPEHYEAIQRDDLKQYHKKHYTASHCTIIVSGIVNKKAIKAINNVFGKKEWLGESYHLKSNYSAEVFKEKKVFVQKADALQSAIRVGKLMFNKKHPDYAGMQVLNTILGGYFGSRLMKNIREDKGYTYGIGSALVSMQHEGYFFITSEVGVEVTNATLDEIYKEIKTLQTEPVPNDELTIVKNYILGSFLKSIDGSFNLADRWKSLMLYGLDYDYYDKYINTVKNITSEQLLLLAQKYFDESSLYELVVGNKTK